MTSKPTQRIGLFGGSFDPVHCGHLKIAEAALESMRLDRILFIPAAHSPLKSDHPTISSEERASLLRLAIDPYPKFELSLVDIDRGGISYSYETVQLISQSYPDAHLYWILGGDQARQLAQWQRIEELANQVEFIALERGDETRDSAPLPPQIKIHPLTIPKIDLSSTEIRQQLKSGTLPKYCLPEPVFQYIKSRNLYRDDITASS